MKVALEEKVAAQQNEIDDMKMVLIEASEKYELQIATLQNELIQSQQREKQLKKINDEFHELLVLRGIKQLQ